MPAALLLKFADENFVVCFLVVKELKHWISINEVGMPCSVRASSEAKGTMSVLFITYPWPTQRPARKSNFPLVYRVRTKIDDFCDERSFRNKQLEKMTD